MNGSPSTKQNVHDILTAFLVPLLDANGNVKTDFRSGERERATGVAKRIPLQLECGRYNSMNRR